MTKNGHPKREERTFLTVSFIKHTICTITIYINPVIRVRGNNLTIKKEMLTSIAYGEDKKCRGSFKKKKKDPQPLVQFSLEKVVKPSMFIRTHHFII